MDDVGKYNCISISHYTVTNKRKYSPLHRHCDIELYYQIKGTIKYFVDGKTYIVEKGDWVFVPPEFLHSTDTEAITYNDRILLSIPVSIFDKTTLPIYNNLKEVVFLYIPPEKRYIIDELLNKIVHEHTSTKIHNTILMRLYTLELLTQLCRLKKNYRPTISKTDVLIHEIAEYIRQNFSSPLTLEQLSQRFAISEGHLSRQFKVVLGVGFNDFITHIRIAHAVKLLSEPNTPITQVAAACGFSDSNYFASVFKKLKGITPYKYSKIMFPQDKN